MKEFSPIRFTITLNKKFVRSIVDQHIDELRYTRPKILKKVGVKVNDIVGQTMTNTKFIAEVTAQALKIANEALEEAVGDNCFSFTAEALSAKYNADDLIHIEEIRLADIEFAKVKPEPHVQSAIDFLKKHGYDVSKK